MSIYKPGRPLKYDPFHDKGSPPPSAPGEYRIRDAAGNIVYVGETNDLRRRTKEHLHHGKLTLEETQGGTLEWKTAAHNIGRNPFSSGTWSCCFPRVLGS